MARTSLPLGFRFHPTDVELVMYYLKRKVLGKKHHFDVIAEVNIYKFSPWDLPDKSCLKSKDLEWFFFCPREKKYASGVRIKRATEKGYWKTTGKDRSIRHNNTIVGTVKTLVFHLGLAPKGERTDWVIYEYRILDDQLAEAGVQDTYVVCKVFKKNGLGPNNGAQYGAPFNEADWTDDVVDDAQNHDISLKSPTVAMLPEEQSSPMTGLFDPGSTSGLPLVVEGTSSSAGLDTGTTSGLPCATSEVLVDDELGDLLAVFKDDPLPFNENEIIQEDLSGKGKDKFTPGSDGREIYDGLRDLDGWLKINDGRVDFFGVQNDDYSLNNMLFQDNLSAYIELNDLLTPLPCSAGVISTDHLTTGEIVGSCSNDNMQQFHSRDSSTGMDQYASPATQLHMLPEGSYEGDNCLDAFWMGNHDLDFARGQPENGIDFTKDSERGRSADN